ncbi:aminodeoxychorismate lyase [Methylocaldum szegediense]|jgi:4-amino-4-deoxychorismate lyase|uniref:Aminodeoxychorismate lyase n=1 Tax=Methylocaldum szegediense TaxID=73780 RepID=A0ABN8XC33_9GAMM|nr:aminodeoxychorismate lyase [Methylocaldum szegediense]CAI8916921.1 4-amino-4-deoxychorismate lyase [Methylocaldum szegediense]
MSGSGAYEVLIDGQPMRCVDAVDRGFQYGDGTFTTITIREGVPLFWPLHLARLERDCRQLLIPFPGVEHLEPDVRTLCAAHPDGVLKIQITRGIGGRGYRLPEPQRVTRVLSIHPPPDYPSELREIGIEVRLCENRLGINPRLAGIKHMNRLEQILARAEWTDDAIREGIMLDTEGYVVEGTMSNLFLIKNGTLYTPKIDRCGVAGVMRSITIETALQHGMAVAESRITLEELFAADEVFLTNCVIETWPVRRFGHRTYGVGPITQEIDRWLRTKAENEQVAAFNG